VASGLIQRPVARRIDRAARAAHRFHRFAHHPLCGQYAAEVMSVGRLRLCRGCALAGAGAALGVGLGLWLRAPWAGEVALAAAALLAVTGRFARLPKSLGRLGFAAGVGLALVSSVTTFALALAVGGAFLVAYRQRGPYRLPCATCPERGEQVCSGFRPMVRRERAFVRLTQRWLNDVPPPMPARLLHVDGVRVDPRPTV